MFVRDFGTIIRMFFMAGKRRRDCLQKQDRLIGDYQIMITNSPLIPVPDHFDLVYRRFKFPER